MATKRSDRAVRDLMTANPRTLPCTAMLADAARVMRDDDIGDVLVEKDGKVCGILTDRDIVVRGIAAGRDPSTTTLESVCTGKLVSVGPDDSADEAVRRMREHAIRRVVVMSKGQPMGIVSLGDLAIERDRKSVLGEVSAAPPNR